MQRVFPWIPRCRRYVPPQAMMRRLLYCVLRTNTAFDLLYASVFTSHLRCLQGAGCCRASIQDVVQDAYGIGPGQKRGVPLQSPSLKIIRADLITNHPLGSDLRLASKELSIRKSPEELIPSKTKAWHQPCPRNFFLPARGRECRPWPCDVFLGLEAMSACPVLPDLPAATAQ